MTPPSPDTFATFMRSLAVWMATFLWLVVFFVPASPLVIGCCLLPARRRCHGLRVILLWFGRTMARWIGRPFFHVRYEDRTGGERTPGIVVANHRAAIDAFLVSLPGLSMSQTVNGWPMRLPVIGWVARLAGYLNITEWDYATLKSRAEAVLHVGDMIVSYPEGTRSESPAMNPFRSGIFHIAKELELPVYMLCIAGDEYMPDRRFRFREFRDVLVRFIGPVPVEEVREAATAYALKKRVFRRMTDELAEMDAELAHGRS